MGLTMVEFKESKVLYKKAGHCPLCNDKLEFDDMSPWYHNEVFDTSLLRAADCQCGWCGYEEYKIKFIGHTDSSANSKKKGEKILHVVSNSD